MKTKLIPNLKNKYVLALFFSCLAFFLSVICLFPGHAWGGDFSQYLAQTRALLEGDISSWLEKNTYIITHSHKGVASIIYPWGFPLILAPFYATFGCNLTIFKLIVITFFSASIFLLFLYYRKKLPLGLAVFATAFLATCHLYLNSTEAILSDFPCMFFSILAICLIERHLKDGKRPFLYAFFSGLFIFCAVFIRTMALGLLLALIVVDGLLLLYWFLFKHTSHDFGKLSLYYQKHWSYHTIPYIVYFGLTQISHLFLPTAGSTYYDFFQFTIESVLAMAKQYHFAFCNSYGTVIMIILFILMIVGILAYFTEELYIITYTLGMLLMLLIYNYYQGARFLFSLIPFILLFVLYGITYLYRKMPPKRIVSYLGIFVMLLALCFNIKNYYKEVYLPKSQIHEPLHGYSLEAVTLWSYINENIPDDKSILFFKPRVLYFMTNNNSFVNYFDPDIIYTTDYILFYNRDEYRDFEEKIQLNPHYILLYESENFRLYQNFLPKEKRNAMSN